MPATATATAIPSPRSIPPTTPVYAMHMYNERIQLLASKEQRRRWEQEARRRGVSLSRVIREAVDAQLGGTSRKDKIAAAEAIEAMKPGPYIAPEELERLIAEAHDEATRFPPEGAPE
jgi:hypothetical protein